MKLKCKFEAVDMGDEIICIPVGRNASQVQGVLKVNKEGYEILKMLEKDTSYRKIVKTLSARYDNEQEELAEFVREMIDSLRKTGLINEQPGNQKI